MEQTAKKLVENTEGLLGKDGRAFPTQREIRRACGDTGSFRRMNQALLTVQLARGAVQAGAQSLDKDFAAVLATMSVPTVAPTFESVTGIPEAALAAFRQGVVLMAVHTERAQAEMLEQRATEQTAWKGSTTLLREQVDDLVDTHDEATRSAREMATAHAAELSALHVKAGVLETAVEFLTTERDGAQSREAELTLKLDAAREALRQEVERRHAAETRAAALEAHIDTRETIEQKAVKRAPEIRARRERNTTAA